MSEPTSPTLINYFKQIKSLKHKLNTKLSLKNKKETSIKRGQKENLFLNQIIMKANKVINNLSIHSILTMEINDLPKINQ